MIIKPAFDPSTRTWWVTEPCKCEAPTIRQLKYALRKLHPTLRFKVADYYVGNSPRTVWPEGNGATRVVVAQPSPLFRPKRTSKYASLYDGILDAWANGVAGPQIQDDFGVTKYAVEDIVALGRGRKDARAVTRKPGPQKPIDRETE